MGISVVLTMLPPVNSVFLWHPFGRPLPASSNLAIDEVVYIVILHLPSLNYCNIVIPTFCASRKLEEIIEFSVRVVGYSV